jgi:hypothetical protein
VLVRSAAPVKIFTRIVLFWTFPADFFTWFCNVTFSLSNSLDLIVQHGFAFWEDKDTLRIFFLTICNKFLIQFVLF